MLFTKPLILTKPCIPKNSSGAEYDVIIPSDYMVEKLTRGLSSEDRWNLITNKDKIIPSLLENSFDKGSQYGVPYYWGTVGIVYDKTKVDEKDLAEGWDILKNKSIAARIYMYDSERDSYGGS